MILTPHAIIGATLTNVIPNEPALGFALAFLSHYALDILPHTDYDISNFLNAETKTVKSIFKNAGAALHLLFIAFDFLLAIFLCVLFFVRDEKSLIITLVGIIGGVLPDFLQFLFYKYKNQPWKFTQKIHDKFHHEAEGEDKRVRGILLQIILPTCFLIVYFLIKK